MRELRLTTSGVAWSFKHQMRIVGSPYKLIDVFLWINDYNMNNNASKYIQDSQVQDSQVQSIDCLQLICGLTFLFLRYQPWFRLPSTNLLICGFLRVSTLSTMVFA